MSVAIRIVVCLTHPHPPSTSYRICFRRIECLKQRRNQEKARFGDAQLPSVFKNISFMISGLKRHNCKAFAFPFLNFSSPTKAIAGTRTITARLFFSLVNKLMLQTRDSQLDYKK